MSLRLFAVLAALVFVGCGPARTLSPEESESVRIGLVVPLSGGLGADGPNWRDAVRLAVREVNSAGGPLPGRQAELLIEDSETNADTGLAVARSLVDRGVVAIVGDVASGSTIGIYQQVTQPNQILQASGLSTSPLLTDINAALDPSERFFFRTVPPDDGQYGALARGMHDRGCANVAILYVDNDYGGPFNDGTRSAFTQLGGRVAVSVPFNDGSASYRPQLETIANQDPEVDCIALIAYPESAGQIVRDWQTTPGRPATPPQWYGTDGIRQPGFAAEVGNTALIDGFLGTSPLTDAQTPAYNRFESFYNATYGEDPTAFSSNLYDAAAMIMLAIAKAGSLENPYAIRDAVYTLNDPNGTIVQAGELAEGIRLIREGRAINYEGASGPVNIDINGDSDGIYEIWRFNASDGMFETVDTISE